MNCNATVCTRPDLEPNIVYTCIRLAGHETNHDAPLKLRYQEGGIKIVKVYPYGPQTFGWTDESAEANGWQFTPHH